MVKLNFCFDSQTAQIRPQFAVAIAFGHAHRFEYLDVAPRRRERDNAGLIDCGDECRRAAIHDRNFRTVDLDHCIVDAKSAQSRQNVFGGRYSGAVLVAEDGCEFGRGDGAEMGPQLTIRLAVGPAAHEHDAGVGLGRMQRDGNG